MKTPQVSTYLLVQLKSVLIAKTIFMLLIIIDARIIAPLGSEEYLLYHLRKSKRKGRFFTAKDRVLHVYSKDFSTIRNSFASIAEICDANDKFLHSRIGYDRAHFCVLNLDTIIFVPEYYDGILFRFVRIKDTWHLDKLLGEKNRMKSYKMLNRDDYPNRKYPSYSIYSSGPRGNFLVRVQNRSLGIFELEDGKIIHFTRKRKSKTNWIMAAELFERDGQFIGSGEVKDNLIFNFDEGDTPIFNEILYYNKGLMYGNALSNYSPIVRVARLNYRIVN
jgi:hypothetical protein